MLEIDTLPSASKTRYIPQKQGVYFLFDGESLVYIGSTLNVQARIAAHRRKGRKRFDMFRWYLTDDDIRKLERDLIAFYRPRYNVKGNPDFRSYRYLNLR